MNVVNSTKNIPGGDELQSLSICMQHENRITPIIIFMIITHYNTSTLTATKTQGQLVHQDSTSM